MIIIIVVVDISLILSIFYHTKNTPVSNSALFTNEQLLKKAQSSLKPCEHFRDWLAASAQSLKIALLLHGGLSE